MYEHTVFNLSDQIAWRKASDKRRRAQRVDQLKEGLRRVGHAIRQQAAVDTAPSVETLTNIIMLAQAGIAAHKKLQTMSGK